MQNFPKPNVIVSSCLGFSNCRYNGAIINNQFVENLKPFINFITTCPEEAIGLGTPRKPIRLIKPDNNYQLIQPITKKNVTNDMIDFAQNFLSKQNDIDGFLLKSKSPSCGIKNVKIYSNHHATNLLEPGVGLFAQYIPKYFETYAIEDEGRLNNATLRHHFLIKLFTYATFRNIQKTPKASLLTDFHAKNKFLFMAYNQSIMREMGQIASNNKKLPITDVFNLYNIAMQKLFEKPAKYTNWINSLVHVFGFFSKELSQQEKSFFLESIEEYRDERIDIQVLIKLILSWALRFNHSYVLKQTFINPYPKALFEIHTSGHSDRKFGNKEMI